MINNTKDIIIMSTDINFNSDSKVWIYPSNRTLEPSDIETISSMLQSFIETWESHGKPLKASYQILEQRFILIAVDESYSNASGCSIDKSVAIIKKLDESLNLGLLNRGSLSYISSTSEIMTINFDQIKKAISSGEIDSETIVFDCNITQLSDLKQNWKKPAKETWLKRMILQTIFK
ncbi:MAG: hypothetical protein EAZ07_07600 [Cytophagales bacterium]|nr:MAG: hypothetical protein EAZ07_07600 [Cytophagales bacterium]